MPTSLHKCVYTENKYINKIFNQKVIKMFHEQYIGLILKIANTIFLKEKYVLFSNVV